MKIKNKEAVVFGKNVVVEALRDNPKSISKIITTKKTKEKFLNILERARKLKIKIEFTDEQKLDLMANGGNHQNILAVTDSFKYYSFSDWAMQSQEREKDLVLILDKIEDTHNFGAIIRTAAAVGVSAIFVASHKQAPVNATVFKTSAGNIFKIKIIQIANLNDTISKLKKDGFWTYAVDMGKDKKDIIYNQEFDKKTAFVLGSEGKGVSEKIRQNCDFITSIPMQNGVESLNVSVSAAIVLYEYRRQYFK